MTDQDIRENKDLIQELAMQARLAKLRLFIFAVAVVLVFAMMMAAHHSYTATLRRHGISTDPFHFRTIEAIANYSRLEQVTIASINSDGEPIYAIMRINNLGIWRMYKISGRAAE
jgi:hypothetical protein